MTHLLHKENLNLFHLLVLDFITHILCEETFKNLRFEKIDEEMFLKIREQKK
jgi:hypothetical protein